jgi:hypothetical protein
MAPLLQGLPRICKAAKPQCRLGSRIVMDRNALVNRRTILVGVGAVIVASPLKAQGSAAGKIDSLHGDAFAERANSRRALQLSADVFVGDLIETENNSGLTMHLGKATTVKLGALAKFRIDRFVVDAGGMLDLDQGALVVDRDDNAKNERLRMRSPFCLIAVRGTMFFAGPSKGVFGVFVGRGVVTVAGGGRTITLRRGEGTDIVEAGSAPSEPKAWGPERVAAALASVG